LDRFKNLSLHFIGLTKGELLQVGLLHSPKFDKEARILNYDELYQKLKNERENVIKELEHLKADTLVPGELREGSPFGKKEEIASETFEFEKKLAVGSRLSELLAEIEHALQKFEQGTYGKCDICGQPIGLARLEVFPQANLCISCKSRQGKSVKGRTPPR
jgi:RNA polymerase-binding protein DksA